MLRRTGTPLLAALLLALAAPSPAALRAGGKSVDKIDPKVLEDQKATALVHWKRVFDKTDPPHHETDHFLLYGTVAGRKLKDVGATLEKTLALAVKVLDMGKEEPWAGKLTVYFAGERRTFAALVRNVEKRRPDADERASLHLKGERPSAIVSPGKGANELNAEEEAAAQVAAALMKVKGTAAVPDWVVEGFARATAVRAATPERLTAEHRRAYTVAVQGSRAAKTAWGTALKPEDAAVVRGSLLEYLAYSGKIKPKLFHTFLGGFRPLEDGQPPRTTEQAFAVANISPARLTTAWHVWARSVK